MPLVLPLVSLRPRLVGVLLFDSGCTPAKRLPFFAHRIEPQVLLGLALEQIECVEWQAWDLPVLLGEARHPPGVIAYP